MELLTDHVEILDSMPHGSVAYLCRTTMPEPMLPMRLRDRPLADLLGLMDRAVERWTGDERGLVELARVVLTAELSGPEEAHDQATVVTAVYEHSPRVQDRAGALAQEMGW